MILVAGDQHYRMNVAIGQVSIAADLSTVIDENCMSEADW
jgi:hypothetical protein